MSTLVVAAYPDEYRAAEVLAELRRLNSTYLIDLEDACYVTKDAHGKLKLHQATSLAGSCVDDRRRRGERSRPSASARKEPETERMR